MSDGQCQPAPPHGSARLARKEGSDPSLGWEQREEHTGTPPATRTHACGLRCCVTLDYRHTLPLALIHSHTNTHTHTPTLTLTLTTHYHSHTLRHSLTQLLGNTLTHSHSDTTHTLRHTHCHTLTLTHSLLTPIRTLIHTFSNTRTHTLTSCPTHTLTHTLTHSHAHTTLTSEEPLGLGDSLPLQHRLRNSVS